MGDRRGWNRKRRDKREIKEVRGRERMKNDTHRPFLDLTYAAFYKCYVTVRPQTFPVS